MDRVSAEPAAGPDLNDRLEAVLRSRAASGVVDIKGHVEVTAATEPSDVKQALVNVLTKAETPGKLQRLTLDEFASFEALYERFA